MSGTSRRDPIAALFSDKRMETARREIADWSQFGSVRLERRRITARERRIKARPERGIRKQNPSPTTARLIAEAEARYGLPTASILTTWKNATVVHARGEVIRELRKLNWSLPKIGFALGINHSTVLHSLRKCETGAGWLPAECVFSALRQFSQPEVR